MILPIWYAFEVNIPALLWTEAGHKSALAEHATGSTLRPSDISRTVLVSVCVSDVYCCRCHTPGPDKP